MSDGIRVTRIVTLLSNNTTMRFHRADLAYHLSTSQVDVDLRDITRVWPRVEADLGERGLFAVRPIGQLRYGVMASTDPLLGFLSLGDREKHVITRLRNDRAGRVLQGIAASGGQVGVLAQDRLNRIQTYLDAYEDSEASAWKIDMKALRAYQLIPWGTFPAGRVYASDNGVSG
jgi:hypothetical protein